MSKVMKPKTQSISEKKIKEAIHSTKVARILALRAARIGTEIPGTEMDADIKIPNTETQSISGKKLKEAIQATKVARILALRAAKIGTEIPGTEMDADIKIPNTDRPVIDLIAHPPLEEKLTVTQSELLTYSLPAPKPTSTKTPKPLNTILTYNACWGHALIENHELSKDAETHIHNVFKDQTPKFKWLWPFLNSKTLEHAQFTHFDKTKYGGDIRWSSLNLDTLLQNKIQITNTVLEAFMALYSDYQWKDLRNRLASHRIHVSFFHV
jgi:hypothetical protein